MTDIEARTRDRRQTKLAHRRPTGQRCDERAFPDPDHTRSAIGGAAHRLWGVVTLQFRCDRGRMARGGPVRWFSHPRRSSPRSDSVAHGGAELDLIERNSLTICNSAPAHASRRNHPSSQRHATHPATTPIPPPPGPETSGCIPRLADKLQNRVFQNPPSRNRSTSSARLRGRRAAASSICR